MAELEQLVAHVAAGELLLESPVVAYKRGSELIKFCSVQVDKVDSQVQVPGGDTLRLFAGKVFNDHSRGTDE